MSLMRSGRKLQRLSGRRAVNRVAGRAGHPANIRDFAPLIRTLAVMRKLPFFSLRGPRVQFGNRWFGQLDVSC